MIKSMTGYGRAREVRNKRDITVEVRSVNNRYLDCTVKMPRMYSFAEDAVKQCVQKAISRGKVDVFITVDASAADVAKVTVNRELAAQYAAALAELSEVCGTESKVTPEQLSRFPGRPDGDEGGRGSGNGVCGPVRRGGAGAGSLQRHAGRGGPEAGGGHRQPPDLY